MALEAHLITTNKCEVAQFINLMNRVTSKHAIHPSGKQGISFRLVVGALYV